jgi:hypothetical protein
VLSPLVKHSSCDMLSVSATVQECPINRYMYTSMGRCLMCSACRRAQVWICAVVHALPCRWGTVVQIRTPAGTITLDDTEITFSEDSA